MYKRIKLKCGSFVMIPKDTEKEQIAKYKDMEYDEYNKVVKDEITIDNDEVDEFESLKNEALVLGIDITDLTSKAKLKKAIKEHQEN